MPITDFGIQLIPRHKRDGTLALSRQFARLETRELLVFAGQEGRPKCSQNMSE